MENKEITIPYLISIPINDIIKRVNEVTYKVGEVNRTDKNTAYIDELQSDDNDESSLISEVESSFYEVVSLTRRNLVNHSFTDNVTLNYNFLDTWDKQVGEELTTSIKNYIVNATLLEFFRITSPAQVGYYEQLKEKFKFRIKGAIHARSTLSKRKPTLL